MEKFLERQLGLSKAKKAGMAIGFLVFLVLSFLFCGILYRSSGNIVKKQSLASLKNICELNEDSITRAFQNREIMLENIAHRIEKREIYNVDGIMSEIEDFAESYGCVNMGVLDKTHTLYRTDGTVSDVSGREITERIWDDKSHITESYFPSYNNTFTVNMFTYPVMKNGEVEFVLIATYYSKDLTARLNLNALNEKGYTFLINSNCDIVIFPRQYEDEDYNRLMNYINDEANFTPKEGEDLYFAFNDENYYAHFESSG